MLLIAFWGAFQLTQANYIEHYGLLRARSPVGAMSVVSRIIRGTAITCFSNWALFHLQRHSDHHAHPTRRYQSLRDFLTCRACPMATLACICWPTFRRCGSESWTRACWRR
ncbi:fatty acid desaturase [Halopseudomonas pachastrellae]|nr:fatty acid desaturase [Halopseudomonas pachastrellae]